MLNKSLLSEYSNILKELDSVYLDRKHPEGNKHKDLSGLFLTSVSDEYLSAKNKIMIVGSETAGWNVLKKDESFTDLDDYIAKAMCKHKIYLSNQLNKNNSRGYAFHNFVRSVAKKCGKSGVIYSNLFCFDWKNGSPINCEYFDVIKRYSELLLKKQIEILKPQTIVFANGITTVPYRREFFPIHGDNKVCTNSRDYSNVGIPNHHLWEFELNSSIRCFRIHHPSARAKQAVKAREHLINLLPPA